jgi:regulator of protease activity HflC (stomatin/prohibitin superfamily)
MLFFYVIKQYERAVVFSLGKVEGPARGPGLIFIAPSSSAFIACRCGL